MEGYKSLREAVASVGNPAFIWRDTINGSTFNLNELYSMGNTYDRLFAPDGWNYFVTFPTGEIGLLSTDDNEIVLLFVPIMPQAKPRSKFCTKCGSALPLEGSFCKMCGARINNL